MGLFDFYEMRGTYEQRKVANYEGDGFVIDTAAVNDGDKPFETVIIHPAYDDSWIVLQAYPTKAAARRGHDLWVKKFTTGALPEEIVECPNAEVAQLRDLVNGGPTVYRLKKGKK